MTSPPIPLPNFFVVGTAKSSTTSLAHFFQQHPEVCFSEVHEPNFFAFDDRYQKGIDFYRSRFRHYNGEKLIGEKSWRYSCSATYPKALSRMVSAIPNFKVIYVVRDPLSRAISLWRELRDGGQDILPANPNTALSQEGIIIDSCRYNSQIKLFEEAVGSDSVKILFFEDFCSDSAGFYADVCNFLCIDTFQPTTTIHANPSSGQRTDTAILSGLRRFGLADPLRRIAPEHFRSIARQVLKKPIDSLEISIETKCRFLDFVGQDCAQLLDRLGRPRSMWNLA